MMRSKEKAVRAAEERALGGIGSGLHACGGRVWYSVGVGGGEDRGQRTEGRICLLLQERDERLEEEEEEGEGYGREGHTLQCAYCAGKQAVIAERAAREAR